jgi:hypothetical protein
LNGIAEVTPTRPVGTVPTTTDVTAEGVALAGAIAVNVPKPKAATATSAMRLIVVFVDICFLSMSQDQEFPALGLGKKRLLICHERVI